MSKCKNNGSQNKPQKGLGIDANSTKIAACDCSTQGSKPKGVLGDCTQGSKQTLDEFFLVDAGLKNIDYYDNSTQRSKPKGDFDSANSNGDSNSNYQNTNLLILWNFMVPLDSDGKSQELVNEPMFGGQKAQDQIIKSIFDSPKNNIQRLNALIDEKKLDAFLHNKWGLMDQVPALFALGVLAYYFVCNLGIRDPQKVTLNNGILSSNVGYISYDQGNTTLDTQQSVSSSTQEFLAKIDSLQLLLKALALISDLENGELAIIYQELKQSILLDEAEIKPRSPLKQLNALFNDSYEFLSYYFKTLGEKLCNICQRSDMDKKSLNFLTGVKLLQDSPTLDLALKNELRSRLQTIESKSCDDVKLSWTFVLDSYQKIFTKTYTSESDGVVVNGNQSYEVNTFYFSVIKDFGKEFTHVKEKFSEGLKKIVNLDNIEKREELVLSFAQAIESIEHQLEKSPEFNKNKEYFNFLWRFFYQELTKEIKNFKSLRNESFIELCPQGAQKLLSIWQSQALSESENQVWQFFEKGILDDLKAKIQNKETNASSSPWEKEEEFLTKLDFKSESALLVKVNVRSLTPFYIYLDSMAPNLCTVAIYDQKPTDKQIHVISSLLFALVDNRLEVYRPDGLYLSFEESFLKIQALAGADIVTLVINILLLGLKLETVDGFIFLEKKPKDCTILR